MPQNILRERGTVGTVPRGPGEASKCREAQIAVRRFLPLILGSLRPSREPKTRKSPKVSKNLPRVWDPRPRTHEKFRKSPKSPKKRVVFKTSQNFFRNFSGVRGGGLPNSIVLGDFFETFRGFGVLGSVDGQRDPDAHLTVGTFQCPLDAIFKGVIFGSGKRGHYERGLFTERISRISKDSSKFSRISRKWSASPFFSTVWRFSKLSRISRKSTFLPFFQKGRRKGGRGRKLSHFSFCCAFRCCVVYSPCFPVWGEEKVMTIYDAGPLAAGPLCGLLIFPNTTF